MATFSNLVKALSASIQLANAYNELQPRVEKMIEEDGKDEKEWEEVETKLKQPTIAACIQLEMLGIELATREKSLISIERDAIHEERNLGRLTNKQAEIRLYHLNIRLLAAGDQLWIHHTRKARLEDPEMARCIQPSGLGVFESLLDLYREKDRLQNNRVKKPRCPFGDWNPNWRPPPSTWRANALDYYKGWRRYRDLNDDYIWCHVSGKWGVCCNTKAAHIIPPTVFLDSASASDLLFGKKVVSLKSPQNSLLLYTHIKE